MKNFLPSEYKKNEKLRKLVLGTILGLDVDSIKYGGE